MGQWLVVVRGGASILKATGRRGGRPLCWLEYFLVGLLVGPIGRLIVEVYQSEKYNILEDKFHHISQFSSIFQSALLPQDEGNIN